ncbi:TPA: NME1-NME2 protein-like [Bos taurus]|nr:TPA: NME1-NME2 protein-like [Bos taurus]
MANSERTFIAIKPDGVQRGLMGEIIKRFEQKGFRLVAMKFMRAVSTAGEVEGGKLVTTKASVLPDREEIEIVCKSRGNNQSRAEGQMVFEEDADGGSLRGEVRLRRVGRTMAHAERTFIAIKPDGVQRGLVGEIIKRFEQKGFRLVAMKFLQASEELLKQHYIDLKDRPFFPGLVKYMNSGPVVAMVWEGLNVVKTGRVMLGETNPADSKPGTIRGDFCIQVGR